MTRFVVRVDDVGQHLEQTRPDVGLDYFKRWWDAGGWGDAPIYLGVVPAVLADVERDWLLDLEKGSFAELAIHGWDHTPTVTTPEDIRKAKEVLPGARCVIPPYNRYDRRTLNATSTLGDYATLLGGFDAEHHPYGARPSVQYSNPVQRADPCVLHLSADERLYKRSYQLVDVVDQIEDPGYPLQIVLHHRWESNFLSGVRELRRALDGRLASVDDAWDWVLENEACIHPGMDT